MNGLKLFQCTNIALKMNITSQKNQTSASQARPPRVPYRNWRIKLLLKFKLSLARAFSSDTSLELAALSPNFAPLLRLLLLRFNHKCIGFKFFFN